MSEIHGAVGAYVVNALDPDELEEFEAHLAVCPTCSREVVEFGETAAELSLLASVPPPPAALRGSILSAISEVRPLPPEPPAETAQAEPTGNGTQTVTADIRHAIDELALRRQQRRTRLLSVLVAAVLAAAVALGGVVYTLVQTRQAQVAQQAAQQAAETELLTAPDVQTYSATMKDGGQISFVVSRSLDRAMFIGKDLPTVGADQTYQLWTLEGERAIPDNLVAGGGDRQEFFRETLSDVTGLAVSVEAAGGAQQPTPSAIQAVTELSS
jgi:anti-sigma-K factor RskA